MSPSGLFDIRKQLTFYGAYHSHPVNVAIHIVCVPVLLWSGHILVKDVPVPIAVPSVYHKFNNFFIFDVNFPVLLATVYHLYYTALDPVAATLYVPVAFTTALTARAFAERPNAYVEAAVLHAICWIAQFIGHGVAEKRAPALLDNIIGAFVLAPFFVHLEVLFALGYRPELHHSIKDRINAEIAEFKRSGNGGRYPAANKDL